LFQTPVSVMPAVLSVATLADRQSEAVVDD
jgi:hypothetical protein